MLRGGGIPDDRARVPLERYVNPRKTEWPAADFVVGNPPFIGNKRMRDALGDGYVEALRDAWQDVPDSADFVMYWWDHSAELTRNGKLRQFGLITTNSLRQAFNRKIVEQHMAGKPPLSLVFAIPDHPWVDSANGAAVRIAMTVGVAGGVAGRTAEVVNESSGNDGEVEVDLLVRSGKIFPELRVGANVSGALALASNSQLSNRGVIPHGEGMQLTDAEAKAVGLGEVAGLEKHIRPYRNGRDITQTPRHLLVIDLHPLGIEEVRKRFPQLFQWLLDRVKPERDLQKDKDLREKWWLHRRNNEDLRHSLNGLRRYIATVQTSKHRLFAFLGGEVLPDDKLIAIASEDAYLLGVLSSNMHVTWALASGARLGVGNDPVYNKTSCFEAFAFPTATPEQQSRIRDLAEQLDAHRKKQQAQHAELTLTGMYNVLEKLKSGATLTAKEKVIHEQGLVAVLKTLHDELDRAVLDAYGWSDLAPLQDVVNGNAAPATVGMAAREDAQRALTDALLERLVALNAERAAEEAKGTVRWLRPEFQAKGAAQPAPEQGRLIVDEEEAAVVVAIAATRLPWPKELPDQVRFVAQVLAEARVPLDVDAIAVRFSGRGAWKKRLPQILDTLIAVGRVRVVEGSKSYVYQ